MSFRSISISSSFNPRARTGRDASACKFPCAVDVSIHAPARGATTIVATASHVVKFQSTRPHGARRKTMSFHTTRYWFQSTRPHGARPIRRWIPSTSLSGFNPRARTGRDKIILRNLKQIISFQSSRPHGARHINSLNLPSCALFQSTRPHGARRYTRLTAGKRYKFQSTRPHGARRTGRAVYTPTPYRFQSTRPHGARLVASVQCAPRRRRFNPRARTGRDNNHL